MSTPTEGPAPATKLRAADDTRLRGLARVSHAVIAGEQAPGGAYPASPTFSAYRGYSWLRDGGFTAEGMSRYGDVASVDRFHDWVNRVLARRRGQVDELVARAAAGEAIPPEQMLPTRFDLDDGDEHDDWWNFQTDGYGTWLWSVVTHARRHGLDLIRWRAGIEIATDYATAFWDVPCYDWWEEHVEEQHVSTLGALYGGLVAVVDARVLDVARTDAAREAADAIRTKVLRHGVRETIGGRRHLVKWLDSPAVDASLASCIVPFGLLAVADPLAAGTLDEIRDHLDGGGVHRFAADVFYGGGQWLLLTCLLGWNEHAAGDDDAALARLRWVADHADPDGRMPEQVPDRLLHPEGRDHWIGQWGPVANPLLWSHGMYLILADELGLLPAPDQR